MHVLGLAGNYTVSQNLQSVFSDYGLRVRYLGESGYKVESTVDDLSIDQLVPSSIKSDGDVFDLKNLRRFGEFLHQPIRSSIDASMPEPDKAAGFRARVQQQKAKEAKVHEERVLVHRMLRFAVTGSVEIPADQEENLDKETAECHAATEQAVRDVDTWRSEVEFENAEEKISSIPNTAFDSKNGFHIKLQYEHTEFSGVNQRKLNDTFWRLINGVTNGRYKGDESSVTLSGNELESLCCAADNENLSELIDRVEFEEAVQEKLTLIEARVQNFSESVLLGSEESKADQLQTLMTATSALTPLVNAEFMRDAWARYNFTERHDAPLESVQKEMQTFMAVADLYLQNGNPSPAQMEAIATEFYSLIAFSGHVVDALDDGLTKQAETKQEHYEIEAMRDKFGTLRSTFRDASIAGVDLDEAFLSDEQRDTLQALRKFAGKSKTFGERVGSVFKAPLDAGSESFLDFAGDVINFIREDPKIAAGFVVLAAVLIHMKGGDPECTIPNINELGELVDMVVDCDLIPKDIFGDQPYHWDLKFSPLKGYELYKHFANSNFITGPTYSLMNWIQDTAHSGYDYFGLSQNIESAFIESSESVVEPLADRLFDLNMFQNVSHAAFWMWAFSRGYEHGPRGFSKLFELAGPVTNLGVQAGGAVFDQFRSQIALSTHLMSLENEQSVAFRYDGNFTPADLVNALGDAAETRSELEAGLPDNIQPFASSLTIDAIESPIQKLGKLDGLTRDFQISAGNFKPILDALQKFDHFMSHVGASVVTSEKWHINPLIERVKTLQTALRDYAQTGDAQTLNHILDENLEYVTASEFRYRGERSEIYEALFEAAPDKQAFKRLGRSANRAVGKEKRAYGVKEARAAMRGEGEEPLKLTGHLAARVKIAGINLWGGMVSSAKTLRRVTDRTINKRNVIVGTGIAATCVGLDLAGVGNEFSNAVSGVTGGTIAASTTIATFLNFNFWEDVVGVHLGTGIGLLFTGAASGYAYKRGIRPAVMSALETTPGSRVGSVWKEAFKPFGEAKNRISKKLGDKNEEWGGMLTRNAVFAHEHS